MDLYSRLKKEIDDFVIAANLLSYGKCCTPDGPEIKKLEAITSFKLSWYFSRSYFRDYPLDLPFSLNDVVRGLNAEGKATYKIVSTSQHECMLQINYSVFGFSAHLLIVMCDWTIGEMDLVLKKITEIGVFDPKMFQHTGAIAYGR